MEDKVDVAAPKQDHKNVLYRATFDAREMVRKKSPVWGAKNKKLLYTLCCPDGAESHSGTCLILTRVDRAYFCRLNYLHEMERVFVSLQFHTKR